jgi:MFS transporter, putative metabolite:H+ symporter
MSKEKRGLGTTIVAAVGILGAVFASLVGDYFDWKMAYIVGGLMGLSLLILRVRMYESGMYEQTLENPDVRKGDFRMLFQNWERFSKYARCILIGVPIWFVIGILITFSPELARELGVLNPISASTAIMVSYIGLSLGDLSSGLLSQVLRSRRKVVGIFLALTVGCVAYYATATGVSTTHFYGICAALGFATGYWAVFVTIGAEQFGTNLRATVATTVPNFVRGSVVPITLGFKYLHDAYGTPLVASALWVGALTLLLAGLALRNMQETFAKDLDYHEL